MWDLWGVWEEKGTQKCMELGWKVTKVGMKWHVQGTPPMHSKDKYGKVGEDVCRIWH